MNSVTPLPETNNASPRAYRPDQLPEVFGLSQAMIYKLLRSGQLRSVRAGRRFIVPADAVTDFLANGPRTEAQIKLYEAQIRADV